MRLLFTFDKLDGCSCMLIVIYRLTLGLLGMYTRSWENVTPIKKIDAFCIWWYQWKARLLLLHHIRSIMGKPAGHKNEPGPRPTGRRALRSNHNGSSTPHNESVFEFQSHHLINFFGPVRVTQKVIFWTILISSLPLLITWVMDVYQFTKSISGHAPGKVSSIISKQQ